MDESLIGNAFSTFVLCGHLKLVLSLVFKLGYLKLLLFSGNCFHDPRTGGLFFHYAISHDVSDVIVAPSLLRAPPLQREVVCGQQSGRRRVYDWTPGCSYKEEKKFPLLCLRLTVKRF